MTHKLKTEMFSKKIEYSGGVFLWPLTPLFSFVSFHLKFEKSPKIDSKIIKNEKFIPKFRYVPVCVNL